MTAKAKRRREARPVRSLRLLLLLLETRYQTPFRIIFRQSQLISSPINWPSDRYCSVEPQLAEQPSLRYRRQDAVQSCATGFESWSNSLSVCGHPPPAATSLFLSAIHGRRLAHQWGARNKTVVEKGGERQQTAANPVTSIPNSAVTSAPNAAAGFATLREIEGRLKSIRNIEKITKTMKIVASTKLTRAQRAMAESKNYGETSKEVFTQAETKALEGEDKKTLLVICSSDKGLCGGVHSGLSRYVRRLFAEKPNGYELVIVGEKCKSQLQRTQAKDIQLSFAGVGKDIPTFADAQAIADQIVRLPNEYAEVQILYNKFINAQSYEASTIDAFSEEAIQASRMSPMFSPF